MLKSVDAGVLAVTYAEYGEASATPVVLGHGFPYDIHAYDAVADRLARAGCRVIVPYLRGYGPTRFLSPSTPRSGQQAALGTDMLALMNALQIESAVVGGYDWGGRAACVVSALWPQRVRALVTVNGYNIQDIPRSGEPAAPQAEHRYWYQYYFHGERGRAGLEQNRRELCRLLWSLWSPNWEFTDAVYAQTSVAFDNPDFVDVVIHSYRHRYGLVDGDPALEKVEARLAEQPCISVPAIALDGEGDGVQPAGISQRSAARFSGPFEVRRIPVVGHNLPQEAPIAFSQAVLDLLDR